MDKKKILVFAHYYVPDVASSGQMQAELVEGLMKSFDVTVITTVPSYEGHISDEYKKKNVYWQIINGARIIRLRVPEFDKTNKMSRIKNLIAYYFKSKQAISLFRHESFDYVFSDSQPPFIGGVLGVYGKKRLRSNTHDRPRFVYNIQDFNPEQIIAVGYLKNRLLLKVLMAIDKRSCRQSDLIIVPGRDLVDTIKKRFGIKTSPRTVMINNWMNENVVFPLSTDNQGVIEFKQEYGLLNKFVIMYSGNLGLYYDLESLIRVIGSFDGAKTETGKDVVFAFVGSGSLLNVLKEYAGNNKLSNVVFIPYQEKSRLVYSINAGDVHWCVNAKGIKGVSCPSKYYGLVAAAKPILGVLEEGTEVRMLIEETKGGLVSDPGDFDTIKRNIEWCITHSVSQELKSMGERGYAFFLSHLKMSVCIDRFSEEINNLGSEK